jgi:hypothetical protein
MVGHCFLLDPGSIAKALYFLGFVGNAHVKLLKKLAKLVVKEVEEGEVMTKLANDQHHKGD